MNQILALREKRAKLWNDTKTFLDSHRSEDGMVSAEDNATYEKLLRWFPVLLPPPPRSRAVLPMSTRPHSGA